MTGPNYVLMTVTLPPGAASVEIAARALGIEPRHLDAAFGVKVVDPAARKYAVMVAAAAVPGAPQRKGAAGPFSNPRIEPFGPPRP